MGNSLQIFQPMCITFAHHWSLKSRLILFAKIFFQSTKRKLMDTVVEDELDAICSWQSQFLRKSCQLGSTPSSSTQKKSLQVHTSDDFRLRALWIPLKNRRNADGMPLKQQQQAQQQEQLEYKGKEQEQQPQPTLFKECGHYRPSRFAFPTYSRKYICFKIWNMELSF